MRRAGVSSAPLPPLGHMVNGSLHRPTVTATEVVESSMKSLQLRRPQTSAVLFSANRAKARQNRQWWSLVLLRKKALQSSCACLQQQESC